MSDKPAIEIMSGLWRDLKDHAERGAIFLLDQDLDLGEVATRIAADDVAAISRWIQEKKIDRPKIEQIETWNTMQAKAFRFAIVQPYVLIQEEGH